MVKDGSMPRECIALHAKRFISREDGSGRRREMHSGSHACARLAGGSGIDSLQERFIYPEST